MPPRPPKATRSIYPDTSTVIYASAALGSRPGTGELAIASALEECSQKGNLCLSYTHLMELTRGGVERGTREVDFLDALDCVWLVNHERAEQRELVNLLTGTVRGVLPKPALPSAPSFLAQFEDIPRGAVVDFLGYKGLRGALIAAAKDGGHRARLEAMAEAGRSFAERLFEDRTRAANDGVSPLAVEARLDEKFIEGVRVHAREAQIRMSEDHRREPERHVAPPPLEQLSDLIPRLSELPMILPMAYTINRAIRGAGTVAARKQSLASRYFSQRGGDLFDLGHLVGAAYCEGFCCDTRTAEQLGSTRSVLGLPEAIVFNGDGEQMAEQIRASIR